MIEGSMCLMLRGKQVLMIHNVRGANKDRWNFPGGHSDPGEEPEHCVRREVREETGLELGAIESLGPINFYAEKHPESDWIVHLFQTTKFSGAIKESDEGRLKWFDLPNLPFDKMWPADRVWASDALSGRFKGKGAEVYYNEDSTMVLGYVLRATSKEKQKRKN